MNSRAQQIAVVAVVAVIVGALLGWAGAKVFTPPKDVLSSRSFTYVSVAEGEVGSSFSLNAVAKWTRSVAGVNQATGIVTSIGIEPGTEVSAGTILYTVNLRPTVAAQGAIPAFRSLQRGAKGPDVGQLQGMLQALSFYRGAINSQFGSSTDSAVRAWQTSLGISADGSVLPGDIIFLPTLPVKLALDPDLIEVGGSLVGGEKIAFALSASPTFAIPASDTQASVMIEGARVEITSPEGGVWQSWVSSRETGDDGQPIVHLEGLDASPICANECHTIPIVGETLLRSKIIIAESVSGLVVPTSAILSHADGSLVVIDEDGVEHEVSVATTAKGISLIEGVSAGLRVRVPVGSA